MSENLDPKLPEGGEERKKPLAAWLFRTGGGAGRGRWGSALLGKFLASKTGVLAAVLGVTALASVAGVLIANQEPVDVGGKSAPQFASRVARYFTPSGARSSDRSSLSLITGNKDYNEEVAKASVEPEAAVEEAAPVPEIPALPSVPGGVKFSPSGTSGSTGGGGSGGLMAGYGGTKSQDDDKKAGSALSDAFNSAKQGAGMRTASIGGRTPNRAASGSSGRRGAFNPLSGKGFATPASAEYSSALERAKAASGVKFGEGTGKVGADSIGAANGNLADQYDLEAPKPPEAGAASDTQTDTGSGGGGGGDTCQTMAEGMKTASDTMQKGVKDLAALAEGDVNKTGLDVLCNVSGSDNKIETASNNIFDGLNLMKSALDNMTESGCYTAEESQGWECGVLEPVRKKSSAYLEQMNQLCVKYRDYHSGVDAWVLTLNAWGTADKLKECEKFRDSDPYKSDKTDFTSLNTRLNSSVNSLAAMAQSGGKCSVATQ